MPIASKESATSASGRQHRWRAVLRLVVAVLVAWAAIGFGVAWFARDLDADVFGWPFGFWVAAQGAPVAFVILVAWFARRMTRLESGPAAPRDTAEEAP